MVDRHGGRHEPKDDMFRFSKEQKWQNHVNTLVAVIERIFAKPTNIQSRTRFFIQKINELVYYILVIHGCRHLGGVWAAGE